MGVMSCAPWGCLLCGRWIGRLSVVSFFLVKSVMKN